ncbi:short-chain dehydrogenase [Marinifilum breve]|uniref:Short-chain dehydrogenase n=1 Tax=Marinifilum breve TaxID=2184082 RepID=A0A2V4A296_9BACT|nr:SDR family NAD(P)-dependent oxidoreductase [Marinifilum breve]PXY01987.1 short-chain dehydrogenase [Marinifilum breve]
MNKVALITGANQGLGFGLVQKLNELYGENDTIYLGVRRPEAGEEAIKSIEKVNAQLEVIRLDVSKEESIEEVKNAIVQKHGGIDLVISNAAARMSKELANKEQVEGFIQTNNMGAYYMLKHFQANLKANGTFMVVASAFGSLLHLNGNLHSLFNTDNMSLEDINKVIEDYVADVKAEKDSEKGWPEWINVPSKIAQVGLTRVAARDEAVNHPEKNTKIYSVCPGLVDTDASRPFFDNMHEAQSPYDAAGHIIDLIDNNTDEYSGKLIQFGKELPWN